MDDGFFAEVLIIILLFLAILGAHHESWERVKFENFGNFRFLDNIHLSHQNFRVN
jgi:hypothetical protein